MLNSINTKDVESWLAQQVLEHVGLFICYASVHNGALWDDELEPIEFGAVFLMDGSAASHNCLRVLIDVSSTPAQIQSLFVKETDELKQNNSSALAAYLRLVSSLSAADFDLTKPLSLKTVAIKKPWGQEIWFTGVESRGVCSIISENKMAVALPLLTELIPNCLLGQSSGELILLKILDPLASPVAGDLYFELHEEKQEVYVVTNVDKTAWPDGVGGIRYGFDSSVVAEYDNDAQLRKAYLSAVKAYEKIRRLLDKEIDVKRQQNTYAADQFVPAKIFAQWESSFDLNIVNDEKRLRAAMERFTAIKPLQVGDVVKVPLRLPHALQHGVRTIEFQTPVYERMIMSFAQKVITQDHWDTENAIEIMSVTQPEPEVFEQLVVADGVVVERIVNFDDFEVQRVVIDSSVEFKHDIGSRYWLAIGVEGDLSVAGKSVLNEAAMLLPVGAKALSFSNIGSAKATLLLAAPKLY